MVYNYYDEVWNIFKNITLLTNMSSTWIQFWSWQNVINNVASNCLGLRLNSLPNIRQELTFCCSLHFSDTKETTEASCAHFTSYFPKLLLNI